jgi:predicted nucleotidyltransferase
LVAKPDAAVAEFLDRFVALWGADDRVAAVFLSGSLATDTGDVYSDVDLMVVAAAGRYDDLFVDRWALMDRLGDLVLRDDFDGFGRDFLLFLYEDGVHGEVDLQRVDQAAWSDPAELLQLVDKVGVHERMAAWGKPDLGERVRDCDELVRRFWRQVWAALGALGRGTLLTAAGYLDDARRAYVDLARLAGDFDTPWAFSGYEHAERALTSDIQAELRRTFTSLHAGDMLAALMNLVEQSGPVLDALHEGHGVDGGPEARAVVTRRLGDLGG